MKNERNDMHTLFRSIKQGKSDKVGNFCDAAEQKGDSADTGCGGMPAAGKKARSANCRETAQMGSINRCVRGERDWD